MINHINYTTNRAIAQTNVNLFLVNPNFTAAPRLADASQKLKLKSTKPFLIYLSPEIRFNPHLCHAAKLHTGDLRNLGKLQEEGYVWGYNSYFGNKLGRSKSSMLRYHTQLESQNILERTKRKANERYLRLNSSPTSSLSASLPRHHAILPSSVQQSTTLSAFSKLIYSEIYGICQLDNKSFYVKNQTLAKWYNCSISTVSRAIRELKKADLIEVGLHTQKTSRGTFHTARVIFLNLTTLSKMELGGVKNDHPGGVKNDQLINNNNKNNKDKTTGVVFQEVLKREEHLIPITLTSYNFNYSQNSGITLSNINPLNSNPITNGEKNGEEQTADSILAKTLTITNGEKKETLPAKTYTPKKPKPLKTKLNLDIFTFLDKFFAKGTLIRSDNLLNLLAEKHQSEGLPYIQANLDYSLLRFKGKDATGYFVTSLQHNFANYLDPQKKSVAQLQAEAELQESIKQEEIAKAVRLNEAIALKQQIMALWRQNAELNYSEYGLDQSHPLRTFIFEKLSAFDPKELFLGSSSYSHYLLFNKTQQQALDLCQESFERSLQVLKNRKVGIKDNTLTIYSDWGLSNELNRINQLLEKDNLKLQLIDPKKHLNNSALEAELVLQLEKLERKFDREEYSQFRDKVGEIQNKTWTEIFLPEREESMPIGTGKISLTTPEVKEMEVEEVILALSLPTSSSLHHPISVKEAIELRNSSRREYYDYGSYEALQDLQRTAEEMRSKASVSVFSSSPPVVPESTEVKSASTSENSERPNLRDILDNLVKKTTF